MTTTYTRENLENLLYKELVNICKDKQIKVKGTKANLVDLILNQATPSSSSSNGSVPPSSKRKETEVETEVPEAEPPVQPTTRSKRTKKSHNSNTSTTTTTETPSTETTEVPVNRNNVETTPTTTTTPTETPISETSVENHPATSVESAPGVETTPTTATTTETSTSTTPILDTNPDNEVITLRMNREGCNSGELHASLIWNDIADLDLHVITPSKEHLYYGQKESRCGGWLDRDMNAGGAKSEEPIENIFWASAPSGRYKIYVRHFNCHCSNDPRFSDPKRSVPFRIRLIKEGTTQWFQGSVTDGQEITCFEFDLKGSGAVGSFVVVPPNSEPATFKELCDKNRITYTQGEGYYSLKKKEDISESKDMVLHNIITDTFVIGHVDVCTLIGVPTNKRIQLAPKDLPPNTRLFIQSTSHNRKIQADTHVLMKVSVREALRFRQAAKYSFK